MQKDSPKIPTDPMHIISTFGVVHQSFLLENGEKDTTKSTKERAKADISRGGELTHSCNQMREQARSSQGIRSSWHHFCT
jgi:hypothetical protein